MEKALARGGPRNSGVCASINRGFLSEKTARLLEGKTQLPPISDFSGFLSSVERKFRNLCTFDKMADLSLWIIKSTHNVQVHQHPY
jgi:hypothetical protein